MLSYSNLQRDSRVLRQIGWLNEAGYVVDAVGLGEKPSSVAEFFKIEPPRVLSRVTIYLLADPQLRSKLILRTVFESNMLGNLKAGKYDLVLMNDLDFLAFDALFQESELSETKVVLDLHEYFPDVGGSFLYRLLHGRYHKYLQTLIAKRDISSFITVSPDIAELYSKNLGRRFISVENMPKPFTNFRIQSADSTSENENDLVNTQLVYHGNPGRGRGLYHLIYAMRKVTRAASLNLVLTGPKYKTDSLRVFSKLIGASSKVKFWPPVAPDKVPEFLSEFDIEVIFFPPPHTTSINLSLPNKFFESLASGLGVVVGPNPTMSRIVREFDCGLVLDDWTISGLARQLSSRLDENSIKKWKQNAVLTRKHYSLEKTKVKFLSSIENN